MLENHPKMEKQKILHFFSQNETIIFKNRTITIKEQRFIFLVIVQGACLHRHHMGTQSQVQCSVLKMGGATTSNKTIGQQAP